MTACFFLLLFHFMRHYNIFVTVVYFELELGKFIHFGTLVKMLILSSLLEPHVLFIFFF